MAVMPVGLDRRSLACAERTERHGDATDGKKTELWESIQLDKTAVWKTNTLQCVTKCFQSVISYINVCYLFLFSLAVNEDLICFHIENHVEKHVNGVQVRIQFL